MDPAGSIACSDSGTGEFVLFSHREECGKTNVSPSHLHDAYYRSLFDYFEEQI